MNSILLLYTTLNSRRCEFYPLIIQPLIQDEDNNYNFSRIQKKTENKTENNILLHLSNFQGSIKTIFTAKKSAHSDAKIMQYFDNYFFRNMLFEVLKSICLELQKCVSELVR